VSTCSGSSTPRKSTAWSFPYSVDQFANTACELVRLNKLNACYVKPIVLRGYGEVGVNPLNSPIDIYMACWNWGAYLGPEALSKGVEVGVSSWTRIAPNTLPAMSKAAANYMNSQLIRMEAGFNGYAEGIALDTDGHVSEGSGMNVFPRTRRRAVQLRLSPPAFLPGITRDAVTKLAEDLNIPVRNPSSLAKCSTSRMKCFSSAPPSKSLPSAP